MKKILLLFIAVCFALFQSAAQKISGDVKDKKGNPLEFARILSEKGTLLTVTDSLGQFVVDFSELSGIEVVYPGFESRWITREKIKNNTLSIVLDVVLVKFDEVLVTNERYHSALDMYSVNIIDYRPFEDHILTIKRKKDQYYIGIDSIGREGVSARFDLDRPRSLYEDCLGNVHVVCTDQVFQIYFLDTQLVVYDPLSIEEFEQQLEPCRGWYNTGVVMEKLSYHNQLYELEFYERGTGEKKVLYSQVDDVTARLAAEQALMVDMNTWFETNFDSTEYNPLYLRRMLRKLNNGESPDIALEFMKSRNKNSFGEPVSWIELMAQYKLLSYPVEVRSLQVGNYLAVVDLFVDSVFVFDQYGAQVSSHDIVRDPHVSDVWQDQKTGQLYLYANHGGESELYTLDMFSGEAVYMTNLNAVPLTKSKLIYDGWLYFRKIENGYHKVYRMKLPVLN